VSNVVNAIAGSANTITIKRDPTNNAWDQVWVNVPATGAPTLYADPSQPIAINGSGGGRTDKLVIDSTNGSPLGTRLTLNGWFNAPTMWIAANQVVAMTNGTVSGGGIHLLNVASLVISGAGAQLDLGNNEMLVTASPLSVKSMLAANQIVTTTAGGVLGYANAGGGQTKVLFTLTGDATLDGRVDVGDLGALATNYGKTSGTNWSLGDFDGNGRIDVGDLGALATHYGAGVVLPASLGAATGGNAAQPAAAVGNSAFSRVNSFVAPEDWAKPAAWRLSSCAAEVFGQLAIGDSPVARFLN
jgi:hypothetical protein